MEALRSCSVLKSACDAATISSCVPMTASMGPAKSVASIRGISGPRINIEAIERDQHLKPTFSRRGVLFPGLLTMGVMLLPGCSSAEEIDDKDFKEKLMEGIDNLQQLVSKSLGDAKEAITTKAEEAMSSLKLGGDEAAETLAEVKSSIEETNQQDKLAQN